MTTTPGRSPRRRFRVASLLLVLVLGGYALWTWGHRSAPLAHERHAEAAASAAAPPSLSATPEERVETLPPLAREKALKPPNDVATGPLDPYEVAHAWVEEDRGQPMGIGAGVPPPPELQHYPDRRRFLAVQMADAQEEKYERPHDDGELAEMIRAGKLVNLPPLTSDYILYDVGMDGRDDPMMHWDAATNRDVPLYPSEADYLNVRAQLEQDARAGPGRAAAQAQKQLALLKQYYDDPARHDALIREGEALAALADNWDGTSYDLDDPQQRQRFKSRLLSCVRPEAKDVILQLAKAYHDQFHRLLPVSSLIRTQRYQRRLGRVNANATHVDIPPHTTGMAFDVSYRYMAPDEQRFLYDQVARLKDEGKAEALRERRNHVHVFVFADGHRPSDTLVASLLDDVRPSASAAEGGGDGAPRVRSRRASSSSTARAAVRGKAPAHRAKAARRTRRP